MKKAWVITETFFRSFCLQTWWNYERLQHWGFAFSLIPFLRHTSSSPKQFQQLLRRHLAYFNTHPYFAPIVMGVLFHRYEKVKPAADELYPEDPTVTVIQESMGAAFGAVGDHVIWGTWRPFAALLTLGVGFLATYPTQDWKGCAQWWIIGFLVIFNSVHFGLRFGGLVKAVELGPRVVGWVDSLHLQQWAAQLRKLGVLLVGIFTISALWLFSKDHNAQWAVILMGVLFSSLVFKRWKMPNGILVFVLAVVSVILARIGWHAS